LYVLNILTEEGFLEKKRVEFPRLYFVADNALVDLLSQATNVSSIASYLPMLFDNIHNLNFDSAECSSIVSVESAEGERLQLCNPIRIVQNPEQWLKELEETMQRTLRGLIQRASDQITTSSVLDLVNSYPTQLCLLGIILAFTKEVEIFLNRRDRSSLVVIAKNASQLLAGLIAQATHEYLSTFKHMKLESLVMIAMYYRDVVERVSQAKTNDVSDFSWQRNIRAYWRKEDCIVSIGNVDLSYCYEYIGARSRLVMTPLTERVYISLSQSLSLHQCGALYGRAGTGKSETIKDIAHTIGVFLLIFNGSDQISSSVTTQWLKGIAQAGAWVCFDELNRVKLQSLAVIAQQISTILNALRQREHECAFVDGSSITVNPTCGMFIVSNPTYIGRYHLPENFKACYELMCVQSHLLSDATSRRNHEHP